VEGRAGSLAEKSRGKLFLRMSRGDVSTIGIHDDKRY